MRSAVGRKFAVLAEGSSRTHAIKEEEIITSANRCLYPLAALVLALSTPVASWWLVGDQTDERARQLAAEGTRLDYAVQPVSLGPAGDRIAGVLACVGTIGALGVLVWGSGTRRLDPAWWLALLPLIGAGAVAGFVWRVLTAGGIGANIGAGLAIMACGPVLVVLLMMAAIATLQMQRERVRRQPR